MLIQTALLQIKTLKLAQTLPVPHVVGRRSMRWKECTPTVNPSAAVYLLYAALTCLAFTNIIQTHIIII